MNMVSAFDRGVQQVIDALGGDITLTAPGGASSRTVRGVITTVSALDAMLVNSVGMENTVLYIEPQAVPPQKFEVASVGNNSARYVIQDVVDIRVQGTVICHKCRLKA